MARILLNTTGSLGDLHPYLAVGSALATRGHQVRVATHPEYRERVEAQGLEFAPAGLDMREMGPLEEVMRKAMARWTGSQYVFEKLVLGHLRRTVDELLVAADGSDLLVSHVVSPAGAIVAEALGLPRVHSVLQPLAMWSAHDPPVFGTMPLASFWARRGPATWRAILALARLGSRSWNGPVNRERVRVGLPPTRSSPLFDLWTPGLNLALFSPVFAPPQPDWPADTIATGFPLVGGADHARLPVELAAFLDAGEPPVVFTLGSAAVFDAGTFYADAARVAATLGVRAVLLTGLETRNRVPPELLSRSIVTCDYAPHGPLFARAAAIVHQGGVGTTARALHAGRPMLVMPYSHDQPDNARRCVRLGVARVIARERWNAARATRVLGGLLSDRRAAASARIVGERRAAEDGAATAAEAIERRLGSRGR
jgi:rhamnosyltransferase subunit B